jgi:hypothetical protein
VQKGCGAEPEVVKAWFKNRYINIVYKNSHVNQNAKSNKDLIKTQIDYKTFVIMKPDKTYQTNFFLKQASV